MGSKAKMPPEGEWFPVAKKLRQTCCCCGCVHIWEFRELNIGMFFSAYTDPDGLEVRITREDK